MRGFLVEAGDENVAQLAKLTFRDVHPPIRPVTCVFGHNTDRRSISTYLREIRLYRSGQFDHSFRFRCRLRQDLFL